MLAIALTGVVPELAAILFFLLCDCDDSRLYIVEARV
jgi:hypothetical protein